MLLKKKKKVSFVYLLLCTGFKIIGTSAIKIKGFDWREWSRVASLIVGVF